MSNLFAKKSNLLLKKLPLTIYFENHGQSCKRIVKLAYWQSIGDKFYYDYRSFKN